MRLIVFKVFLIWTTVFSFGPFCIWSQASNVTLFAPRAIIASDNPDVLTNPAQLDRNIQSLDVNFPKEVMLELRPWADLTWKLDWGLLARRYADPEYSKKTTWPDRYSYLQKQSAQTILQIPDATERAKRVDQFSPTEKYDLLIGDDQFTLTQAQLEEGRRRFENNEVATWMGICDGGAAAAALYPEPQHSVELSSPTGERIVFHILDIKGLASLLWSTYNNRVTICGSRGMETIQTRDDRGIVSEQRSFDVNPGSWHIAVLNIVGKKQSVFFMDRFSDVKVWNVPILGYHYQYLDALTEKPVSTLAEALTPIKDLKNDPYKKYRSPLAEFIVQVEMTSKFTFGGVVYRDKPSPARLTRETFRYDLEINHDGEIIGGEWHTQVHPDFLWAMPQGFAPSSRGDWLLGKKAKWDGGKIPADWVEPARVSSRKNQPLEKIVKKLVEMSQ